MGRAGFVDLRGPDRDFSEVGAGIWRKDHGAENLVIARKLALDVLERVRPDISIPKAIRSVRRLRSIRPRSNAMPWDVFRR